MEKMRFFIGLLLIITISCSNKKSDTIQHSEYPIIIDIKEAIRNKADYRLSDIVDSITYLPVESLIGEYITFTDPNKIRIGGKYILCGDYFSKDLLLYNRNGTFIRKLAKRGQGPWEYVYLDDLAIDEINETVYVLSRTNRKIFKYNFNGSFLGEIVVGFLATKIVVSPDGRLLVHFQNETGELENSFLLLNHKGDTVNIHRNVLFYRPDDTRKPIFVNDNGIYYIYDNKIHIKDRRDTLFIVENDRFIPKYVFNTGDNISNNMTQTEFANKLQFRYILETYDKVLFEFRLEGNIWYRGYYDKNQAKAFTSKEVAIINDIDDTNNGVVKIKKTDILSFGFIYSDYQYNDKMVMYRNSEFDMDILKKRVSENKYVEIMNMLDSVRLKDDDPVILSVLHLIK